MDTSLNLEELQKGCIKFLNARKYISVATAYNNRVRSRVVDYANRGLQIGFITWENTIKIDHFKKNPLVSLCVDALQIEGTVKILGHPHLAEHAPFMELYKERHPSPYGNFVSIANSTLIMVEPTLLILMKYEDNHLYLDHLDVIQQIAFRKELSPWNPSLGK